MLPIGEKLPIGAANHPTRDQIDEVEALMAAHPDEPLYLFAEAFAIAMRIKATDWSVTPPTYKSQPMFHVCDPF